MAYYGLSKPIVAKRKVTNDVETYEEGFQCGKAVGTDITPNYNEASQHGDNELAEYVKEFKDADVTLNVTTLPDVALTVMFGHTIDEETKETNYGSADKANDCGYGFCASEVIDGESKYIACWLPKVKFTETAESYSTKGDSIEFKTPTLNGKASPDLSGQWKYKKAFTTEEDAEAWLKEKAGIGTA